MLPLLLLPLWLLSQLRLPLHAAAPEWPSTLALLHGLVTGAPASMQQALNRGPPQTDGRADERWEWCGWWNGEDAGLEGSERRPLTALYPD